MTINETLKVFSNNQEQSTIALYAYSCYSNPCFMGAAVCKHTCVCVCVCLGLGIPNIKETVKHANIYQ